MLSTKVGTWVREKPKKEAGSSEEFMGLYPKKIRKRDLRNENVAEGGAYR